MDFLENSVIFNDTSISELTLHDEVPDYETNDNRRKKDSKVITDHRDRLDGTIASDGDNETNHSEKETDPSNKYARSNRVQSTVLTKNVVGRRNSIGDSFSGTVDAISGMPIQGCKTYVHLREHYDGPFLNGMRHGDEAVSTFLDGSGKYIGSYFQDSRMKGTLMKDDLTYTGTFKDDIFHGKGLLARKNGTIYEGAFENGLMHGKGKLIEKKQGETNEYIGYFVKGKKDGEGSITMSDGSHYNGQWKNDKKHGKGLELLSNGERYEGNFENDEKHGEGRLTTKSNLTMKGTWRYGVPVDGKWDFIYQNGTMYEGRTVCLQPFGHGIMTYFDQNGQNLVARYEGDFINGLRHGFGMCKFDNDGTEHWGDWVADEPLNFFSDELVAEVPKSIDVSIEKEEIFIGNDSISIINQIDSIVGHEDDEDDESIQLFDVDNNEEKGPKEIIESSNGVSQEEKKADENSKEEYFEREHAKNNDSGTSDYNEISDQANEKQKKVSLYRYTNGDTYCGLLNNNAKREGHGTYVSERLTTKCICEWSDSQRHGKGQILFPCGITYEGEFDNNMIEGSGTITLIDGTFYSGKFERGLFNGKGTLKEAISGRVYVGNFVNGMKNGNGEETYPDGTKYVGEFKQGKRFGQGILFKKKIDESSEDQVIYDGEWVADHIHGEGERFYEHGHYQGMFSRNKRNGRGVYFIENGCSMDGQWEDDKPMNGDWVLNFSESMFYGMAEVGKTSLLPDNSITALPVPSGFGTSKNSSGILYSGYFEKGKKHGTGICVFPDGTKWDGRWENDIYVKYGKECPS